MVYCSNNFVALFGSIKKKIYKILNDKVKEYDLSFIEAIYLIIIGDNNNVSYKELTKLADCDKAMTTKVVYSLERKDLVKSDTINNKKIVYVTSKGKDIQIKIKELLDEFKNKILEKINKSELIKFYDTLYNFNKILEGEIKC